MPEPIYEDMQLALDRQKKAFLAEGIVSAEERNDQVIGRSTYSRNMGPVLVTPWPPTLDIALGNLQTDRH